MEALSVLAGSESEILNVLEYLNKIENGSDDVNKKSDFLGADLLPSLEETSELMEQ